MKVGSKPPGATVFQNIFLQCLVKFTSADLAADSGVAGAAWRCPL